MRVRTLEPFRDKRNNLKTRIKGEVFEVTPKRFKEINSTIHGIRVEELEEETKDGKGN